ncbi:MAG: aminoacetone oxidase family FAD-binding enzyme [Bacteroidaceae bacterium]|nr:aminoacetone oxidase family FAD-binding enzyme [Bacteroidaceae bacterium]
MNRAAIIGGGAAGFFLAICLKEMQPEMEVSIFERSKRVLRKVEVSGGGRCNCTNSFLEVKDLQSVYPRGHRLLKRLFKQFDHTDAYRWFEGRGVPLVTQEDQCVFPRSQDSHSIINLFLHEAKRLNINIITDTYIQSLSQLSDFDYICITTGGQPQQSGLDWLHHPIEKPVPSLFTFNINDAALRALMGTVVENATAMIPGTKLRASGALLITHWGMSGPCILRLSSYAARLLSEHDYRLPLSVNWTNSTEADIHQELDLIRQQHPQKQLQSIRPFSLPQRLWNYLLEKSLKGRGEAPWGSLNQKEQNRLVNTLMNDTYQIAGRAAFKDEFVTCGGISLSAVNPSTLESRLTPHLYFAGEVLDIDGVTGGFNFQAAWTTAYTVAKAISEDFGQKIL